MPFRARVKRALIGGPSDSSDLKGAGSKNSKNEKLPDNVYKPGEAMPRPKYRGPYNQAHQDKLTAFSFGNAWSRRKSSMSQKTQGSDYSPMGSRLPSQGPSRRGSGWSGFSGKRGRWPLGSRQNSNYDPAMKENADDDVNVANVGLSRQQTAENIRPAGATDANRLEIQRIVTDVGVTGDLDVLQSEKTVTNGHLFTEDELANAMTQSTLKPSTQTKDWDL